MQRAEGPLCACRHFAADHIKLGDGTYVCVAQDWHEKTPCQCRNYTPDKPEGKR